MFSIRTKTGWGLGEIPDLPGMAAWAADSGIGVVQLLPVCAVTGGETSPYSAATAFAIDPVYLGLDACEDFLAAGGRAALAPEDQRLLGELQTTTEVAWHRIRSLKDRAARLAFAHFRKQEWPRRSKRARELTQFCKDNRDWIDDWALFSVLHQRLQKHWKEWPAELANRQPAAIARAVKDNAEEILYATWLQWQLDEQWQKARAEAATAGVELMGDLPFVVSEDSADVWKERAWFRLGMRVGTPPDFFSPKGQDWGLPLFDWRAMERDGFSWMRRRAGRMGRLYGLYRVDHVIGMYRTYYRSADGKKAGFSPADEDAQIRLGETLLAIMAEFGEVIAEDLGTVPEFLISSLARLNIPGYKVQRWEKDGVWRDGHAQQVFRDPAKWPEASVATSGTHDTSAQAVWYDELSVEDRRALLRLPGLEHLDPNRGFDDGVRDALLRMLYQCPSCLCLLPFQDFFGAREQVNVPGTVNEHNWSYRMPMSLEDLRADAPVRERLFRLAAETRRLPGRM